MCGLQQKASTHPRTAATFMPGLTFMPLFMCKCWRALSANMSHRHEGERPPPQRHPRADAAGRAGLVRRFNERRTNSWPNKSKRVNRADPLASVKQNPGCAMPQTRRRPGGEARERCRDKGHRSMKKANRNYGKWRISGS